MEIIRIRIINKRCLVVRRVLRLGHTILVKISGNNSEMVYIPNVDYPIALVFLSL